MPSITTPESIPFTCFSSGSLPGRRDVPPRWEQHRFTVEERSGRLRPVASAGNVPETLTIDQDAVIYVSSLRAGEQVIPKSRPGRKAYLFLIAGGLTVNGASLAEGDQARIADEPELTLRATEDAELILLDLPDHP